MSGITYTKATSLAASPRTRLSPVSLTRSRSLTDEMFTKLKLTDDQPSSKANGKAPVTNEQGTESASIAADPFIGSSRSSTTTTGLSFRPLSAGASNFQPRNILPSNMSILNRESIPDQASSLPLVISSQSLTTIDEKPSPDGNQDAASTDDQQPIDKGKGRAQDVIGTRTAPVNPAPRQTFTTDQIAIGHFMKIEGIMPHEYEHYMQRLSVERDWENKLIAQKAFTDGAADPRTSLSVALCFDDVANASSAEDDVNMIKPSWTISYISSGEFADVHKFGTNPTSFFEGQVYFQATYGGDFEKVNVPQLEEHVSRLAGDFGKVIAIQRVTNTCPTYIFRVEFQRISQAREVLKELTVDTPHYFEDWVVSTKRLKDPPDCNSSKRSSTASSLSQYHIVSTPHRAGPLAEGAAFTSPSGRTAWQQNKDGTMIIMPAPRAVEKVYQTPAAGHGYGNGHNRNMSGSSPHTPAPFNSGNRAVIPNNDSWPRQGDGDNDYPANGEPQSVNVDRILSGVDVRTTIMLRNLPNQWGATHMKRILDTTSWGAYDFSYLRIDFQRNTNVGYAFVNFCQATDIVPFFQTYIGREWDPTARGRKRAQISYATIQGYDCLIEKFRNSSIMDEYAEFRPKIWWTKFSAEADPKNIGTEKEFPAPNNLSKKQRSHDNAGSIGLYAPRSGQRGTDRHRRSLYDRGTTSQIREDAMLNQNSPMGNNYSYQSGPGPIGPPPPFGRFLTAPSNFMGNAFFPLNNSIQGHGMQSHGMHGQYSTQDPFQTNFPHQMSIQSGAPVYPSMPFNSFGHMGTNNPASELRTISRGRLAGRPRNVTTAPNVFDGTAQVAESPHGVNFNPVMYSEQNGPNSSSAPRSMHQHSQHASQYHYQHQGSNFMPTYGHVQGHSARHPHQAGRILQPNEYINGYGQIEMAGGSGSSGSYRRSSAALSPQQTIRYLQQSEHINGHVPVDMAESSNQAQSNARHST